MTQERPAPPYQVAQGALKLLMTDGRRAANSDTYILAVALHAINERLELDGKILREVRDRLSSLFGALAADKDTVLALARKRWDG